MRLFVASIIGAALLAVSNAAPVPRDAGKPLYFATTVGDEWVYTWKRDGKADEDAVEVVTNVEKKDGAVVVTTGGRVGTDGKGYPFHSWTVSEQGIVWTANHIGQPLHEPWQELKLPSKPGQVWEVPGDGLKTTMTARAPERINVPAGEFEAIGVEQRDERSLEVQITRWYAPGVGVVRLKQKGLVIELKSFTPGKP